MNSGVATEKSAATERKARLETRARETSVEYISLEVLEGDFAAREGSFIAQARRQANEEEEGRSKKGALFFTQRGHPHKPFLSPNSAGDISKYGI